MLAGNILPPLGKLRNTVVPVYQEWLYEVYFCTPPKSPLLLEKKPIVFQTSANNQEKAIVEK